MGAGGENLQIAVEMNLIDLRIWKPGAEPRPRRPAITRDINTIVGSRVESACRFIDLERPNRRARKIAADVCPGRSAVRGLVNVAAAGCERSNRGIRDHVAGRIHLDVLYHSGNRQVALRPGAPVICRHKYIGRTEPARVDGRVNCVRIRGRDPDCVHKSASWIPTTDVHCTDIGP